MNGADPPGAKIEDVRRLWLRTVGVRGVDDLARPAEYFVPESVASMAVRRLRRRGLLTMAAFVVSVTLIPPGLIGFIRCNRRVHSLHRYGWRREQIEADGKRTRHLRFPGNGPGTGPANEPLSQSMTVVTTYPVAHRIPLEFRTGAVLVGGRGRHLTLVFARGPVLAAARRYRTLRA